MCISIHQYIPCIWGPCPNGLGILSWWLRSLRCCQALTDFLAKEAEMQGLTCSWDQEALQEPLDETPYDVGIAISYTIPHSSPLITVFMGGIHHQFDGWFMTLL